MCESLFLSVTTGPRRSSQYRVTPLDIWAGISTPALHDDISTMKTRQEYRSGHSTSHFIDSGLHIGNENAENPGSCPVQCHITLSASAAALANNTCCQSQRKTSRVSDAVCCFTNRFRRCFISSFSKVLRNGSCFCRSLHDDLNIR